jgi:hypothetical protein
MIYATACAAFSAQCNTPCNALCSSIANYLQVMNINHFCPTAACLLLLLLCQCCQGGEHQRGASGPFEAGAGLRGEGTGEIEAVCLRHAMLAQHVRGWLRSSALTSCSRAVQQNLYSAVDLLWLYACAS